MDIFEFALRYHAYEGLSDRYDLGRGSDDILAHVRLRKGDAMHGKLQDQSVDQLRSMTRSTYSPEKQRFLSTADQEVTDGSSLCIYVERLEYELKVIKSMGFNTYFLIVQDFIVWAKTNEIMVGPGRGSGAGSLLAYCLRITDIDPLPYGLLFERFLNPARVSMPDFDVDFEDSLRDRVIQYVIDRYGEDKVAAIGTYMQLATKAAFKDAARAMGVPFDKSNTFSAAIADVGFEDMLAKPQDYPDFAQGYENDQVIKRAVDFAIKLEGNLRQLGVHACGILITPEPVTTYTAIQPIDKKHKDAESTEISMAVAENDGKVLENLGLLKMDFLGLRNLSVIKNCIKIIRVRHKLTGKTLPNILSSYFDDMSFHPPLDDEHTFREVFQAGDTTGIFQFEGSGMRRFLVDLKATDINDLVAMSALYRPGPMEFIPRYIDRKHGKEPVAYMLDDLRQLLEREYGPDVVTSEKEKLREDLDPIMGLTYGIAVYQEQLMFLVQAMAGFSLAEADNLRRGVGKKIKSVIDKIKPDFISRCASHRGYKPETALWIFEKMIEPAASYSFNKSHSVCYSWIAYQTGYLKAHYPLEFYAALLRSKETDTDKLSFFIDEARAHGIDIRVPDVNVAFPHVAAVEDALYLGFLSIKGVGYDVGDYIERERGSDGSFDSLEDFLRRCQSVINKKSLEGLIKSGAIDVFGHTRETMMAHIDMLLQRAKQSEASAGGLFGGMDIVTTISWSERLPSSLRGTLEMEYGVFNNFVSVHPFDGLYPLLKKYTLISQAENNDEFGAYTIFGYIGQIQRARKKGFFVKIVDISGEMEVFLSDKLDLKVLDVVEVSGYKGRRRSIDSMIIVDLEAYKDDAIAKNKYDSSLTVAAVQKQRREKMDDSLKVKIKQAAFTEDEELIEVTDQSQGAHEVDITTKESTDTNDKKDAYVASLNEHTTKHDGITMLPLPDDIAIIQRMTTLLKQHPGDQEILIGDMTHHVSDEGLDLLRDLVL